MISTQLYEAVADLHKDEVRNDIKRQVYYDINRILKHTKKGKKFIEVFHSSPSILIDISQELNAQGYFTMVAENAEKDMFLRIYLKDS